MVLVSKYTCIMNDELNLQYVCACCECTNSAIAFLVLGFVVWWYVMVSSKSCESSAKDFDCM